ncbi:MAG: NADH-ubiquinone oxidoreductase-F iron-sulfur binding region domain-containing protein [Planctomycetota bacterium]|nr:NADH-ubiquinone oxidoreductase-F iron-sulfur binding region domain-containing protein [Planctomycetota bacterium]MDI6787733.1 NADH-ubiquinone oxidoreductase-F iron-sulfur binding region domain-containing protein [Planctomycetota bacterium]
MRQVNNVAAFQSWQDELMKSRNPNARIIIISSGTCGIANGSKFIIEALTEQIRKHNLDSQVSLRVTGCLSFCQIEPLIEIQPESILYTGVKPEDVPEIMEQTIKNKKIIERLLYIDPVTGKKVTYADEIPFYNKQSRIISGDNLKIDPTKIEDYISIGGYSALAKALSTMKPEAIIDMIKKSGLRGRGGGGFPAGVKWESCHKAHGDLKYVICNADEGDPGAYANRGLLEGNPHSVLEGMIIGAYAIGSNIGYIYIRDEYPLAVELFENAIKQAEECGLLGRNILGSGFNFVMNINRGGGAFVCGESSALMASLEGKIGEPRAKYIHMVERGLYDRPSCLNNVETWANIPLILNKDVDWFTKIGTGDVTNNPWGGSKGTKIFSLVGKVNNTGLVEVPMGITLREIVYGIGGGIRGNKRFKAVQTGGPSGGCIPDKLLDLQVDYDRLTEAGSMMGSGGMIVMDEYGCMVDVACYFLNFLREESCGKCVPCREGIERMWEILNDICEGRGQKGNIELLMELSEMVKDSALCQLGATAPNPVLTTLKYFYDEYEAHIKEEKCPAGVCKALIHYTIDEVSCKGCGACVKSCPGEAISGEKKKPHKIDQERCIKCGVCIDTCKFESVKIIPGRHPSVKKELVNV